MMYEIVAVRDIKTNAFSQPQFVPHQGGAIRAFGDQCMNKDPQNIMGHHPEDFELYYLGQFNDQTGKFEQLPEPVQIAVGSNYRMN